VFVRFGNRSTGDQEAAREAVVALVTGGRLEARQAGSPAALSDALGDLVDAALDARLPPAF
jgi:hypothetical protein